MGMDVSGILLLFKLLDLEGFPIEPAGLNQFLVASGMVYPPVFQDIDPVTGGQGGDPVGNDDERRS